METLLENPEMLAQIDVDVRRTIAERLAGKYGTPIDKQKPESVEPLGVGDKRRPSTWMTTTKTWRWRRRTKRTRARDGTFDEHL
jgi:hypothetical protein